ncbi:MAG: DUF3427 domain-containing protein [Myxococcales bacterium]|nr:DUF3427 domain-containing protein [Myxococcales bacterium]
MSNWRRPQLAPGIYDEPISQHLQEQLEGLTSGFLVERHTSTDAEPAGLPLESLLGDAIGLALQSVGDKRTAILALAQEVLAVLHKHAPRAFPRAGELQLLNERLLSIAEQPAAAPKRPRGSLHASSLLVNAEGEQLHDHLRSEFDSADRVDLLCAFVKLSGFEKVRTELERHCVSRGRPLRVLTTTYMGASDAVAIERLAALANAEVKVSYDEHTTRLHAKAWVFHRANGYSTAYVGSSNLSHAAQTDGLEWNVRVTERGQPALVAQMVETFEQYWGAPHQFESFRPGHAGDRARLSRALSPSARAPDGTTLQFDIEAKDFQKPILSELVAARVLGRHKNLLVAATGTGKTVMAALDYQQLRQEGAVDTLLFVAHRREILDHALATFRAVLKVSGFGELLCEGEKPAIGRHVFASIDSLAGNTVDPAAFDLVIIDEAHHSPADSWEGLLKRIRPKQLLGLTGTPERADGLDHERHFPRPWIGNLRVWTAIPHALVPFRYYMLDVQGVDLRDVAWTAGKYAPLALAGKLIGAAEVFVHRAVQAVTERIARPDNLRAIAFCADVRHAEEIHRRFLGHGFRSQVLTGTTPKQARRQARSDLDSGQIQVLCVVDIYNEGVDVPNVNTLFFFRPTESATVFLQQLGRGLRRAPGKSELVVFDLTGRQHLNFRFDRKLRALLGHTPREVHHLVKAGFGRLPAGCHLHFDEQARQDILDQIKRAIPSDETGILALLHEPAHSELSLDEFLKETDVELNDVYRQRRSWTGLRRKLHLDRRTLADGEPIVLDRVHKLTHVGDEARLELWQRLVDLEPTRSEREHRLARMLFAVLYGKEAAANGEAERLWSTHASVRDDVRGLIPVLRRLNAILPESHTLLQDVPIVLHARYLGVELSAAFDDRSSTGWFRDYFTGVETIAGGRFDLLLVTMEKAAATKEHLRYRDFPLSDRQFHWQSKARTTLDSKDGRRHLHPEREGVTPLLLVRELAHEANGRTMAFRYLGPVHPLRHAGERPISVEWGLRFAMPAEVLASGRVAA